MTTSHDAPPVPAFGAGLWRDSAEDREPRGALDGATTADVVVVGAGIVGLTTALLAVEAGLDVVVLEAHHVAHGTTGGTTGKLTSQNETRLATLRRKFGADGAARYTRANERGMALFDRLVAEHGIDAEVEAVPARLVAMHPARVDEVREEAAAARAAGMTVEVASSVDELDLPCEVALTVPDQRQCHPVRYVHGLADAVERGGGRLHEATMVTGVGRGSDGLHWAVTTSGGRVTANHVVLATRLPSVRDRRLLFGRTMPTSAAGVAARIGTDTPTGMYLLQDASRTWSIRGSRSPRAGEHLVAIGMGAETGDREALAGRGHALGAWVAAHWQVESFTHTWMAQDQQPVDGRPYIGALADGLWTTTGLGKWGLAMGTAAADAMVTQITGGDDPDEGFFAPSRIELRSGWQAMLGAQLRVGLLLVGDRLTAWPSDPDPAPGEGLVVRHGRTPVATCRTHDGERHTVAATCTHLGCLVRWNRDDQTWDCGCHGSRFAPDGAVLEAPATAPLRPIEDPADG